ncbi:MAG: hypothetical protein WC782_13835 [Methylococcaceae bacterium]|jgi:hypothetical protein
MLDEIKTFWRQLLELSHVRFRRTELEPQYAGINLLIKLTAGLVLAVNLQPFG